MYCSSVITGSKLPLPECPVIAIVAVVISFHSCTDSSCQLWSLKKIREKKKRRYFFFSIKHKWNIVLNPGGLGFKPIMPSRALFNELYFRSTVEQQSWRETLHMCSHSRCFSGSNFGVGRNWGTANTKTSQRSAAWTLQSSLNNRLLCERRLPAQEKLIWQVSSQTFKQWIFFLLTVSAVCGIWTAGDWHSGHFVLRDNAEYSSTVRLKLDLFSNGGLSCWRETALLTMFQRGVCL